PWLQPKVAWNPAVVFIDAPVALAPVVKLARPDSQPRKESSDTDLRLLRPAPDEIYHLIPHIMRHPALGQSSPRLFFKATCSAISSARTSSLVWTFFSKNSIRFCFSSTCRARVRHFGRYVDSLSASMRDFAIEREAKERADVWVWIPRSE